MPAWNPQANDIFLAALEIASADERSAYLDEACRGQSELLAQVRALLTASENAGNFLASPPSAVVIATREASGLVRPITEGPGTRIGPYKLLQQIGEGGFGIVHMAEQQEPVRRKVALKIIKPGMDTKEVIARFESERQALALMDHPNIARVLDAGATDSGRPYFVMELVKGIPIIQYCDNNHLPADERLELFTSVCHAVQHAHQKGVIHRDLKPSNVMVTMHDGRPVPKVIDFGVAKATSQQLTERTLFTAYGQLIGTPAYMSPEQAEMSGLDVDTRSDIYSLGVLLYELLTGSTPFDSETLRQAGFDEMRRIIREEEPETVSARLARTRNQQGVQSGEWGVRNKRKGGLVRRLFTPRSEFRTLHLPELDWIVMKCLEKDRERRYETAIGLAREIQRYLHDEPVQACPPSLVYRVRKLLRRHRGPVLAASLVVALLACGIVGTSIGMVRARSAQKLANDRLVDVQQANTRTNDALRETQQAKAGTEKLLKRVEASLYCQSIARADLEWWANNVGRADQILDECPPEYRQWEWNYLKRLCHTELLTLRGHVKEVTSVAFSPNGRQLASASADQTIKIWDLAAGNELLVLRGHNVDIASVAFTPDGRLLASAGGNWEVPQSTELKVWDATTGSELRSLRGHTAAVAAVAFHPDSQRLASAGWDGTVKLWDATTGQEIRTLRHSSSVKCVGFSPDGRRLAAGTHNRTIQLWDVADGRELLTIRGHAADVLSVAFSPDGRRLASGSWDQTIRLWNAADGRELMVLRGHTGTVQMIAFSPDSQRLGSASADGTVKVWRPDAEQEALTLRGHSSWVRAVAFSPGGQLLASASWDGTVKIWDGISGQESRQMLPVGRIPRLAFSPDSQNLVVATSFLSARGIPGFVSIWALATGKKTLTLAERLSGFRCAVFSPDGRYVASDWENTVKLWDVATGRVLTTLTGHQANVTGVAWNADGSQLASASEDQTLKVWQLSDDLRRGAVDVLTLSGHQGPVTSAAFSSAKQRLASAGSDGTVRIWDAATGAELRRLCGHDEKVTAVAFSSDGQRLVSSGEDMTVRVWDPATGLQVLQIAGHLGAVTDVAFSPDGQRLASASMDGSVRLWDAVTGEEALSLRRQLTQACSVAFSRDGRYLAAGEYNGGFKFWDAAPLGPMPHALTPEMLRADARDAAYRRGRAHADLRQWDKSVANYSTAIELGLQTGSIWTERATAYAMLGQCASAAADFARAVAGEPDNVFLWYCQATAHLGADDMDGYRQVCAVMRRRFGNSTDPAVAGRLLCSFLPRADAVADTAELVQWGKCGARSPEYVRILAAALCRDRQFVAAISALEDAAKIAPLRGDDLLFLAMAQHQLGKDDDARGTLARAVEWIDRYEQAVARGGFWIWYEQVEVRQLRREAEALIIGAVPDRPNVKE